MPSESRALSLSALLSRALIVFTKEFDGKLGAGPAPSLAMWSNVLRFVGDEGIDQRELPRLSGVSKPVVQSLVACLERHGWITIGADAQDPRVRIIRLTPRGRRLSTTWEHAVADVENDWRSRFGKEQLERLRHALEAISEQIDPSVPHYPMAVAHRGGTPTGH